MHRHHKVRQACLMLLTVVGSWSLAGARDLSFEERVEAQRAIEQVYWSHRDWPATNPDPKPSLSAVLSEEILRARVGDSMTKTALLDSFWDQPLRGEDLQAEIDRMAKDTKSPEVLRELFAALGNDPLLIAECLARPLLAERRVASLYARDERIHGAQRVALEAQVAAVKDVAMFDRLDGDRTEITYVLDDTDAAVGPSVAPVSGILHVGTADWDRTLVDLASSFGAPTSDTGVQLRERRGAAELRAGARSPLLDRGDRFAAFLVTDRTAERITVAVVTWPKRSYEDWQRDAAPTGPQSIVAAEPPASGYRADPSLLVNCTYDTWSPMSLTNAPSPRAGHVAVWTGSEMIVWGGYDGTTTLGTGRRYVPSTDSWGAISTVSPPAARQEPTAVWTGSVMIVWGGRVATGLETNTGSRYNPTSNTWAATSTAAAPGDRQAHSAVWTGTQMIIWGGLLNTVALNTGGRYNPSTDAWIATSMGANVPTARYEHTAVWTGSRMIVWSGTNGFTSTNTGGRYDPATDSWLATSTGANVISARILHSVVWTGAEMIVWGGQPGGGRYNPTADTWSVMPAGPSSRQVQTAIWTGNDMIVWAGRPVATNGANGGRFVPATNTWPATSLTTGSGAGVPAARYAHTAVWAPSLGQMIVWGGSNDANVRLDSGALYCAGACVHSTPCNDANPCTGSDTCASGTCAGTPIPCVPTDSCHDAGVCNPATGACSNPIKPNGTPCQDGNPCTASCPTCGTDTCVSGVCGCPGTPASCQVDCSDGDACTSDTCSPSLGCQYACSGGGGCGVPGPVAHIGFDPDKATLRWDHATGGASSRHDVAQGRVEEIPIWSFGTTCLASGLSATSTTASALPTPGNALWYDVRGHHLCGAGPWGSQSNGTVRAIVACP